MNNIDNILKKYKISNNISYNYLIIIILILVLVLIIIIIYKYIYIPQKIESWKNIKRYNIARMSIFKNEQFYMEEWLNHHISQGIEHIYLYCNDPNIENYKYLSNLKYKNYITIINWIDKSNDGSLTIQRQAYTDCVKKYSNYCQFLLMLDLDEFLIPIKNYLKVSDYIYSLKANWNSIKAFKIQRYDFGSNGHIKKPLGSVISNYKLHEKICSSYKTMANTDFISKNNIFYGVHDFNFIDLNGTIYNDYFGYHETGFPNSCKKDSVNEIPMVINHYYTKSYEEYLLRCNLWKNGGINPIGFRTDCENNFKSRDVNEIEGYL